MVQTLTEIAAAARQFSIAHWWLMVIPALIGFFGISRFAPQKKKWWLHLPAVAIVAVGLVLVVRNTAIFDDAYYSFRCARNFVDGHGLVYNPGQFFEIYTNFLWVMWLSFWHWVSDLNLSFIAVVSNYACYLANLLVIYKLSLTLNEKSKHYFPLAILITAWQYFFLSFGSSGLETMAGSLLVNLGVYFLIRHDSPRQAWWAGLFFILATLNRMDHSLFFLCGALVLVVRDRSSITALLKRDWANARVGTLRLLAFLAPLLLYAVYLLWKLHYYGSIFPSAFYAKSAAEPYLRQGLIYTLTFYFGSHFHVLLPLFVLWLFFLFRGKKEQSEVVRTFGLFALTAITIWHAYVIWVGGDYLIGRFFVVLMPLMILGVEHFVFSYVTRRLPLRFLATLVAATAFGAPLLTGVEGAWCVMDGRNHYLKPFTELLENRHDHSRTFSCVVDKGFAPLVLADAKYGYDTALPVIDRWGITDPNFAHRTVTMRSCPGHEKYVSLQDVVDRGIRLSLIPTELFAQRHRQINDLKTPCGTAELLVYDPDLIARIKQAEPAAEVADFPVFLDDYLAHLSEKSRSDVAEDLKDFQFYYFNHRQDMARLQPILDYLAQ